MNSLFSSLELNSPTVIKAIRDGYTNRFFFDDGCLYNLQSLLCYPIIQCLIKPEPCLVSESVIYRVDAPDGLKGIAIVNFDNNESF